MTALTSAGVTAVTDAVTALGDGVFADLDRLRATTAGALSRSATRAGLAPIERVCTAMLTRPERLLVGAGYVAAPGVLTDCPYWLEWWTVPGVESRPARPARLQVVVDPTDADFRDYTRLPWFTVPEDTGRRHVTGPYVDYLCTDEYTLTFTVPVTVGDAFVGVVGADVHVRNVEKLVLPRLDALPEGASLVNAQGRVVVSNDPTHHTGSLVRDVAVAALWAEPGDVVAVGAAVLQRCGDLPLGVLVLAG